jgi:GMP synthase (glutamine-hydrolysing)
MLDTEKFIEEKVEWLRNKIGGEKAVAAVSGGVDSMTTAVLGHRAIGDRQIAVFLDDGLMREGEPAKVLKILKKIGVNAKIYEVSDNFFKALKGIPDPEEKRKAFRETFYRTLADVARELRARFLLQGTIAADIVETAGGVKTQHNVLEQIGIRTLEKYGFEVLEPIKDLYKPQVRQVARALGLPKEVFERRPFPGPGLSVRIIGEVTPERVEIVRKATEIVEEETKDIACFQAFAVLMNDRGTGITPDRKRKYGDIVVIRVVESEDAMKAKAVELPWEKLNKIKKRIIEDLPSVTHVLYDLTDKPPATIEFE